jgi:hypothetical protein
MGGIGVSATTAVERFGMLPIGWRFGLAAAGLTAMCGDCATAGNESRFTAQFNLTLAKKEPIIR